MQKKIKCLVWDLDNTLWEGTLAEDQRVTLKEGIPQILETLDQRGILLSIASKNDPRDAMKKLEELGLSQYFIYPQINWNSKADSLQKIAQALNINLDTFAFIDDQAFEREEIHFQLPQVLCIDAENYAALTDMPQLMPRFVTQDSRLRRQMYQSDLKRKKEEEAFQGSSEAFLATLDMHLLIAPVKPGDLERVEELTVRTNQLNSTGYTYDFEQLEGFISSDSHIFLIASLEDRLGTYGKIGLILLEESADFVEIKLLLMSCRVMTRGIGSALLVHIIRLAHEKGKRLRAQFVDTGRNRVMYITYKLMGFAEADEEQEEQEEGSVSILEYRGEALREYPDYLKVEVQEG